MFLVLILIGLALPVVEVYLLLALAHVIGGWATLALLIAEAIVGSWLFKRAGVRAWRGMQTALAQRRVPGKEIADGALALIGATLLMIPGLLTDVIGLLCVLPFTRPLVRLLFLRRVTSRIAVTTLDGRILGGFSGFGRLRTVARRRGFSPRQATGAQPWPEPSSGPASSPPGPRNPESGVIIDGEVIDKPPAG